MYVILLFHPQAKSCKDFPFTPYVDISVSIADDFHIVS